MAEYFAPSNTAKRLKVERNTHLDDAHERLRHRVRGDISKLRLPCTITKEERRTYGYKDEDTTDAWKRFKEILDELNDLEPKGSKIRYGAYTMRKSLGILRIHTGNPGMDSDFCFDVSERPQSPTFIYNRTEV